MARKFPASVQLPPLSVARAWLLHKPPDEFFVTQPLMSLATEAAACTGGTCTATASMLPGFASGVTFPNIFGMLLVYGLGLILAATLINYRRRQELGLVYSASGAAPRDEIRAQREASDKYIYPYPTAEKAAVLRCLTEVARDFDGQFRVTNRADMARLARRPGVSNSDWYRAMAAYHMTRTDFSVLNRADKAIAAVEFVEQRPTDTDESLDRMRREALAAAGLPILVANRGTTPEEIGAWLRPVLAAYAALPDAQR